MKTLITLISDIFDIVPDKTFAYLFVTNDKINIDAILNHNLLKVNTLYCHIWQHMFGIYPTKKDFISFLDYAKINPNDKVTLDTNLVIKMINSIPFMKIGLQQFYNMEQVIISCQDFLKTDKLDCLYNKLAHRYCVSNKSDYSINNLIVNIFNIKKSHCNIDISLNANPITNSINELIVYEPVFDHMTYYEKLQYVITQDLNFMMSIMGKALVYNDSIDLPESVIKTIIDVCENSLNTQVVLFNSPFKHDPLLCHQVNHDIIHVLPSIVSLYVNISNNWFPKSRPLSRQNSIHFSRYPYIIIQNNPVSFTYDKYISNSFYFITGSPYVIFDPVPTLNEKSIQMKCVVRSGLIESSISKLRQNFKEVTFTNDICDDATIVIDIDSNADVLQYLRNGMIPIVTDSPYIIHMVNGVETSGPEEIEDILYKLLSNKEMLTVLQKGVACFNTLCHQDFVRHMWDLYLKTPSGGILLYTDFLQKYYIKRLSDIMSLEHIKDTPNCVLLVDNRENILSVISVLFSSINLNASWSCYVYTSAKAKPFYERWLGKIATIVHVPLLDVKKFHINVYNWLLTSTDLWDNLSVFDKCLIIQDDGVILRKGIENFIEYDYVGAPWAHAPGNEYLKEHVNPQMVGNGGLSLRSPKLMHEIVKEFQKEKKTLFFHNINNIPEDVYFAKYCQQKQGKIPSAEVASFFSSEEIINDASLGFHKVWAYHHPNKTKEFFDKIINL